MRKLLIPAMGVAAAFGIAQPAAAQIFLPGQPGVTGTQNRTVAPGTPGISPFNRPATPSPYTIAPSPGFAQPSPFIGQRGELNFAEPEAVGPGEPDASGKINPTSRTRARFAGERGPDGKLLPTYSPQEAQATSPTQTTPQATPPTPSRSDMPGNQPSTTTRPPRSGTSGTMGSGTTTGQSGTTMQDQQMHRSQRTRAQTQPSGTPVYGARSQQAQSETAALNALSAEGYTNVGKIERVGKQWQTTAMKDGRQVTVQVDPQTNHVTTR